MRKHREKIPLPLTAVSYKLKAGFGFTQHLKYPALCAKVGFSLSQGLMPRGKGAGFTIIETLIAIAILLLAITGPLSIAERGLVSAQTARQEVAAFYLAQEAVEYIRNTRDGTALSPGNEPWLEGLGDCIRDDPDDESGGCGIDPTHPSAPQRLRSCSHPQMNSCRLRQYTGGNDQNICTLSPLCGLFGYRATSGWTESDFTRKVFIDEVTVNGEDDEARVTVRIEWATGSLGSRTLRVSESLLNWYAPE